LYVANTWKGGGKHAGVNACEWGEFKARGSGKRVISAVEEPSVREEGPAEVE